MSAVRYWHALTTVEAARLAERDPVAVLPVAAIEQHGPHLPLSTDLDIGLGLLARAFGRLPDDFPAWTLPPAAVGSSREHARFAGTLSLDPALLGAVVHAHGAGLARAGVRRLVLANSHGGNRAALDAAALGLRDELGMLVVTANYFLFPRPDGVDLPESEWRHGLHGGAVETAMMLHLRPDLVRTAEIETARPLGEDLERTLRRVDAGSDAASFAWLAGDLDRSGAAGDAARADAAAGRRLVDHYGAALAEVILDAREFPIDRLADFFTPPLPSMSKAREPDAPEG